jgi:hypothetical protein
VRARLVGVLAFLALAGGCGGSRSPEQIVRAWSDAINHGQNDEAAELMAPNAKIVQQGRAFLLPARPDALRFNTSLPCQGRIVALSTDGNRVTASFLLDNRGTFACGGVGTTDTAVFTIRHGRIAVWELLPDAD